MIGSIQFLAFTFREFQPGKGILAALAGCRRQSGAGTASQ